MKQNKTKQKGFGNVRLGGFQVQFRQHIGVPHRRRREQLYASPAERHGEIPAHRPKYSQQIQYHSGVSKCTSSSYIIDYLLPTIPADDGNL